MSRFLFVAYPGCLLSQLCPLCLGKVVSCSGAVFCFLHCFLLMEGRFFALSVLVLLLKLELLAGLVWFLGCLSWSVLYR